MKKIMPPSFEKNIETPNKKMIKRQYNDVISNHVNMYIEHIVWKKINWISFNIQNFLRSQIINQKER